VHGEVLDAEAYETLHATTPAPKRRRRA
jgi:hypothetical protein